MPKSEGVYPDLALDALDSGLIVLDAERRIVAWNSWLAAASGIEPSSAMGRLLGEILPEAEFNGLTAAQVVATVLHEVPPPRSTP